MVEDHDACLGIRLTDAMEFRDQKRRIDQRAREPSAFHDRAGLVPNPLHFQLKNDAHRVSGDVQGLFQRGNTLPVSCIEPLHLLERHFGECS